MKFLLVALVILASAGGLCAQTDASLPPGVAAAIAQNRKDCGARVVLAPRFVESRDINGDGRADYILDYGHFECDGNAGYFCGTAGCLTQVFASLPDGSYAKVLDENVRGLRFSRVRGRPAMLIDLHGLACGRGGAAPCALTLYWNGFSFSPAN